MTGNVRRSTGGRCEFCKAKTELPKKRFGRRETWILKDDASDSVILTQTEGIAG